MCHHIYMGVEKAEQIAGAAAEIDLTSWLGRVYSGKSIPQIISAIVYNPWAERLIGPRPDDTALDQLGVENYFADAMKAAGKVNAAAATCRRLITGNYVSEDSLIELAGHVYDYANAQEQLSQGQE
jgi:hypothetical protein